jgi:hypothetical protein
VDFIEIILRGIILIYDLGNIRVFFIECLFLNVQKCGALNPIIKKLPFPGKIDLTRRRSS